MWATDYDPRGHKPMRRRDRKRLNATDGEKSTTMQTIRPPHSLIRLHPRPETTQTSQGRIVLVTGPDGIISEEDAFQGLWAYQTCMLSHYCWLLEGKPLVLSASSNVDQHTWMGYYIQAPPNCKDTPMGECDPLQETIELRLSRSIGAGMHEEVDITNHTQIETSFRLELKADCDFGDPGESKRGENGHLSRRWLRAEEKTWELEYEYKAEHAFDHQGNKGVAKIHRGIKLRLEHSDSEPTYSGISIAFTVKLAPHAIWHACLNWIPQIGGRLLPLQYSCGAFAHAASGQPESTWDAKREKFLLDGSSRFRCLAQEDTLTTLVLDVLNQSKRDLAALRLYDLDQEDSQSNARDCEDSWIVAAGIPTYLALFGRDSLMTAWQSSMLGSGMMRGALATLPHYQATGTNNWRDAQPGRMMHEVHTDPTAELNYTPHHLYYGGVTASIFYPLVVADLWHWRGGKELVRPFVQPALKGLAWADRYSRDTYGFYKYQTRSQQGEKNQGWKDSEDAIVHADGSQAKDPIGTCEMQAFVYASKLRLAELLWWMGEEEEGKRLYTEAQELKKRFNEVFWMEDEGFIAMGIDAKGRLIRSIASDPGQCLAHGIVDDALAPRVIARLMEKDMFSGWGIRTLSASHPAYNPFAYHRGTVWPVMNGIFALGFARHGSHKEMQALSKATFEAASLFEHNRLPEVFAGHQRDAEHPFPGMYTKANWPQAWSASAPVQIMQSMLGIVPYAPLGTLLLDPSLPEWLPDLRLERLRVGDAVVTLDFNRRDDGKTEFRVADQEGPLHIVRTENPWSLLTGTGQALKDRVADLVPDSI